MEGTNPASTYARVTLGEWSPSEPSGTIYMSKVIPVHMCFKHLQK